MLAALVVVLGAASACRCAPDRGIWGPLLEDWAVGFNHSATREDRVMRLPPTQDGYVTATKKEYPPAKVATGAPPSRPVSETDLYLLAAMEKLVYRADLMEKRLRRVEQQLQQLQQQTAVAGSRVDREPCPDNFTRAGARCYHFAAAAGRERDWKAAKRACGLLGAALAELETIEENQDVVAHVVGSAHLRGRDFWTGGLNPGLLWIWSDSARPVPGAVRISGDGRCLRLAYDPALRHYAYRGSDCAARHHYVCEQAGGAP